MNEPAQIEGFLAIDPELDAGCLSIPQHG